MQGNFENDIIIHYQVRLNDLVEEILRNILDFLAVNCSIKILL